MTLKKLSGAIIIFILVILGGGVIYSNLEGWSLVDAIYFSAVTITTLGYGDFVPRTGIGKIFTILFSVSGIAIGLYILTVIGTSIFTIDLHRRVKVLILKNGRKFNVEKLSVGMVTSWKQGKNEVFTGVINEIGLDYVKLHVEKKNEILVPKKDQKILIISSEGRLRKYEN
ncbi:hypothetical protein COU53_03245 [Candidatus Pacearchaeota archaeon CG10_big_fil_rev_8_21_14_0_10_30_48]|nr:MAG: hypothetical protein COU53_03245 [Candidatus Pacearchaeota archaeon CG10_big_fil_rev_8_21_14_0_10_30_48]